MLDNPHGASYQFQEGVLAILSVARHRIPMDVALAGMTFRGRLIIGPVVSATTVHASRLAADK